MDKLCFTMNNSMVSSTKEELCSPESKLELKHSSLRTVEKVENEELEEPKVNLNNEMMNTMKRFKNQQEMVLEI